MQECSDWCVVGGGILGAVCALRLAQSGASVSLIESAPTIGGLTRLHEYKNIYWEQFYHVIERTDLDLLALIEELGLTNSLCWGRTNTNYLDEGRLFPLNNSFDYLRLPLSLIDKIRIGLTIIRGAQISNVGALDNTSLTEWLHKWSGQSALDKLWLPLLAGKLGDNYKIASAAFICSVIKRFYGARAGASKVETFGYTEDGYRQILRELAHQLTAADVRVITQLPVESIRKKKRQFSIVAEKTELNAKNVLVCTASPIAAQICVDLPEVEKRSHLELTYQGVICVSFLLTKPAGNAYLTYITDRAIPFTTIIEMSSLVSSEKFQGYHLVYLPKYLPADDPMFDQNDEEIKIVFIDAFLNIFDHLVEQDIVHTEISKARYVSTVPTLNYQGRLPSVTTSVPGLYICNSAQITDAALSVNESVKLANDKISLLLSS